MKTTLEILQSILASNPDLNCRIPAESVLPGMHFKEDLGLDSLGMMLLLFELQGIFPHLEERDLASWRLVSDCTQSIERSTQARGPG